MPENKYKEPNYKEMWDNLKCDIAGEPDKYPDYKLVDVNELRQKILMEFLTKMHEMEKAEGICV